jgi:hypothetical protein
MKHTLMMIILVLWPIPLLGSSVRTHTIKSWKAALTAPMTVRIDHGRRPSEDVWPAEWKDHRRDRRDEEAEHEDEPEREERQNVSELIEVKRDERTDEH